MTVRVSSAVRALKDATRIINGVIEVRVKAQRNDGLTAAVR